MLDQVPEPGADLGSVVVEALAAGICGTDAEIADGAYGWAPPGEERLILGHESLGRVIDPGPTGLATGDHVVGIVRRPDPMPCPSCAVGEWDMCSNGLYTERGIKQVHGFMSERWRIEPEYVVRVDKNLGLMGVLLEPTTVVAKAWEQILTIGRRTFWEPRTVLVVGAGPIGLLAALIGVQRGLEVHVLDRVTTGPKPALVAALGAVYHTGAIADIGLSPNIVVECTGVVTLVQRGGRGRIARRHRLPHRHRSIRSVIRLGFGAPDRGRTQELGDVRIGERQSPQLPPGRGGARQGGPRMARTTHHAAPSTGRCRSGPDQKRRRHQGRHGVRVAISATRG